MANLSNINNFFVVEQTTGYVGIGNTDPGFPLEVKFASAELALNATGGSIYRVRSTASDEFIITRNGVDDFLTLSSGGDATFRGSITTGNGTPNTGSLTVSGGLTVNWSGSGGTTAWGNFSNITTASANTDASVLKINQKNTGGTNQTLEIGVVADGNAWFGSRNVTITGITLGLASGNATFSGNVTVQSGNKLILNRPNNAIDCELSTDSSGTLILNSRNGEGFKFQNAGTNFVTGDSSNNVTFAGNVKIGTSTTGTPAVNADDLVIDKGASESGITLMSTAAGSIRFGDAANTSIGFIEYNHNSNYMRFGTDASERMRISSGGTVKADAFAPLDSATSLIDFSTDNVIKLFTNSTERLRITSTGQVQVGYYNTARGGVNTTFMTGKSGTTYLELNGGDVNGEGGILFADGSGGNYGLLNYSHVSDIMQFYTASAERMRIKSSGSIYPVNSIQGTYFGQDAGNPANVTGVGNTSIGYATGQLLTSGYQNVSVGRSANEKLTTGYNNVSVGTNAGYNNVDGLQNTYIGTAAGYTSPGQNYNTFVGYEAGHLNEANENTAVGRLALTANTTGGYNTAIGTQALTNNTTQEKLTALGYRSGYYWTGGNENTFIGYHAGFGSAAGSTGGENTLVGSLAGANTSAITGNGNTSLGRYTLFSLTDGEFNTALGHQAGGTISTGDSNTLVGKNAGDSIGGGSRNSMLGQSAGQAITSGSDNIGIGHEALYNVTTGGSGTIAIGAISLYSFTGSRTIAIGYGAGRLLASAIDNVFIGQQAGELRTGGIDNTAVGAFSQYGGTSGSNPSGCCNSSFGRATLYSITVGVQNTAIGRQAGYHITNGYNNTLVGHNTALAMVGGYDNTCIGSAAGDILTSGYNNTCIGYNSDTPSNSSTNTVVLGNTAISSLQCQVQTISALSDERDKTNIKDSNYGLNLIDSLRPVTFEWNQRDGNKTGKKDLGFIAQDLQKVNDEHLDLINDENPEKLLASYGRLIPVLVKSIQELKEDNDSLKARIETLENK